MFEQGLLFCLFDCVLCFTEAFPFQEVPDSHPDPQLSLTLVHLLSSYFPVPVLVEFAVSSLLWTRSLAQSWYASALGLDWLQALQQVPLELASSGPLRLR